MIQSMYKLIARPSITIFNPRLITIGSNPYFLKMHLATSILLYFCQSCGEVELA